jgi:hypothetical protein
MPPVPTPRSALCVEALDGKLLLIGGQIGVTAVDTVEAFDPSSGSWTTLDPMPTPRSHASVARVGEAVFVIGGFSEGYLFTNERYGRERKILHVQQRD